MAVSRIEILVAILLFSLGVQGGDYFDCHRKGQDCANNKACKDGGRCDCGDDYSGDDCGLTLSEKGQSPCASDTDSCGSDGGLCYNNGGSKACYCPADSYGNQCENKRYQVTCSTSSILIVLNPFGTFDGVVYVKDQKETSGCTFATADLPSGKNGLALNVADADCGSVTTDQATSDRSRVVIVQYNDKYITDLDTKLTVTCSPGGAVTIDVTKVFLADGNLKGQGINNTVDIDSSAVDFDIKLKDGTAVTSSTEVPLDDLLTFEFNGDKGPQPVPTSALRLINGSTPNVGRLQIFRNGEWGTICTSGLNSEVARVVCRQLGMESPQARFVSDHFGPVSGNMWKFRARCIYSESALERCSLSRWRQESCKKRDIGGISCPSVPKNLQFRLVNGSTDKEGRLEVFYNNQWGTICDKYFDTIAAAVACKMLGHRPVGAQMLSRDDVTDGTGPIWMSSIDCNPGSEDSLTDCEHHGWEQDQEIILNSDNCQHKNDVGIRCEGDIYSDLKIRLRNGSHEQEGRVEIFHDNQWGTMTDTFFYHLAAKVICRMLGFPTEGATPRTAGYFPAGTGPVWVDRLLCKGDETNINECQYWAWDENRRASYDHTEDAGVTCGGGEMTSLQVRLVNGSSQYEGRVEVFYDNQWGTLCDDNFSYRGATVICRMLGLPTETATPHIGGHFPSGTGPIWMTDALCRGSEANIANCRYRGFDKNNVMNICMHSEDAGVTCAVPSIAAIRVESCTADNKHTGDELESLKIIENSCPSSEIGKLMREKPTRSPDTKVTFQLQPWTFNKFLDISVSCTVKVCPVGQASSCDATNCDGGGEGFGRKRRSLNVSDEYISDEYVRKSFTIRESSVKLPSRTSESLEETDDVSVTTLIVAGVAMVITMMLVITIVVILLLRMKRSKRNSKLQDVCQQKQVT